ncbi:MAG: hypothetical protein AAB839_00240 [Patescibacteria group bacterium]
MRKFFFLFGWVMLIGGAGFQLLAEVNLALSEHAIEDGVDCIIHLVKGLSFMFFGGLSILYHRRPAA